MKNRPAEEQSLRAYLLGELNADEQRRVEEELLLDRDHVELLLIIEEELMDAYVSQTLSERERQAFEERFLITPDRRRKLRMAKTLRRYVNNQPPAQARRSESKPSWWRLALLNPAWRSAFAALLVLGVGLAIWRLLPRQSLVDKGRTALQAARQESPIEARVAGFNWPPPKVTLGGPSQGAVDNVSMERAFSYFRDAVNEQPGPETQYALGQFYLAKGELDKAIEQFNLALAGMPNNAKLHSDLGAALLAMAVREGANAAPQGASRDSSDHLFESLEHLNRALELDPALLEALFNRALCHQQMQLPAQAEADWQAYLSRDAGSPWADEARRHLKEIGEGKQKTSKSRKEQFEEFLGAYRSGNRQAAWTVIGLTREVINGRLIWWQLLDDFFNLIAAGQQAEADARINALRFVGDLELRRGDQEASPLGDPYTSELAEFYSVAPRRPHADLPEAHQRINAGNQSYLNSRPDEALDHYTRARTIFARLNDKGETMLADLLIGYCRIQNGETEQSESLFERLANECRRKGYRWLFAQSAFSLGMAQDMLAEHSKALENTRQALAVAEEINDSYNAQRCLAQIADQYRKLGNYELSTTYLARCLKQVGAAWPGDRQMWRTCDQLTQVLAARRLNAAAAAYASEALRLAVESDDPSFLYVSYIHLGLIRAKQQDHAEAIRLAELGVGAAPDPLSRAYAALVLGDLRGQAGDWGQALGDYDQSLRYMDSTEALARPDAGRDATLAKTSRLPALRYGAHKGRLFCLFAQGDDAAAQDELTRTLALLEKHRASIREEQNRNTFFNVEQSVYDAAIAFAFSKRNDWRAVFEYSEKSRARSLLDLVATAQGSGAEGKPQIDLQPISQPLDVEQAQRRLPEQTQLIEYAALDDKLLICRLSKSEFSVKQVRIGLSELTDKVLNFRRSILRHAAAPGAEARELYDLLITGAGLSPEQGQRLCIVPDKVLNNLPFAALVSSASGSYLIEDYQLTLAPSTAVYLACSARKDHTTDRHRERLLAVGDPAFDRAAFPELPPLPSTAQQVKKIAEYYPSPSPVLLTGIGARKEVVRREMPESDVIHLASHYVVYEGNPMNSKLLLAREPGGRGDADGAAGFLQADEIYGLNLRRAPLVVLSACESGVEHYYNGEGMIGLSRVFIAAGAPLVVASMWKVDAYATDELMISLHRHRQLEGLPTSEALRLAQVDMLKSPSYSHPYYWAGFAPIGGHTDF